MSYTEDRCRANCSFCAQAREHTSKQEFLSRVIWPDFSIKDVLKGFKNPISKELERICIQIINYTGFQGDIIELVKLFKDETRLPISVDTCPVSLDTLLDLQKVGVERVSIPLDGSTPEIFDQIKGKDVKGPYRWENHFKALRDALRIFGIGNVCSNIIIGLGETEMEAISLIQRLSDMHIAPVLFAFTPLKGTKLENLPQPPLESYRRIQVALSLVTRNLAHFDSMSFDEEGNITNFGEIDLYETLKNGEAFRTIGCPGCNRPFYNERPMGPFYNYPRPLNKEEVEEELRIIGVEKNV
jgi:biotin synthase